MTILNIAVLGWGSSVNQPNSSVRGVNLQIEGKFEEAEGLRLPIRMSRLASKNKQEKRFILVIDRYATNEKVYYAAMSKGLNLHEAKENLEKQEGIKFYKISYLKLGNRTRDEENYNIDGEIWSGKKGCELPEECARDIIQWARNNEFNAVIWMGLTPNIPKNRGVSDKWQSEMITQLEKDPVLLENTKKYIKLLPQINHLQQQILNMNTNQ